MTFTLNFQGQIWNFAICQTKMGRSMKQKKPYWLNSKPRMWPLDLTLAVTLTLNFQGKIWNTLYLGQKWSDCHETKSKHIDWTLSLKCDQRIWPWPWIFKVQYGIPYIMVKNSPIARKQNSNISLELNASKVIIGFDLGDDLDDVFSR